MSEMEWDSFEKTDNQAEEREKKEGQEGFVWEDAAQRASSGLLEKVLSGW